MFKGKTSSGADVSNTFGLKSGEVPKTWILVANRVGAKLFERGGDNAKLEFPKEFPFPSGRIRESELTRDQPGRAFNSSSQSHGGHGSAGPRHALGGETTHHDILAREFAANLAAMLEKGEKAKAFAKLVLVAEPRFMGILKAALSNHVKDRIFQVFEKDIAETPNHVLGEHLVELLQGPHLRKSVS